MTSLPHSSSAKGILLALETSAIRGSVALVRVISGQRVELLNAAELPKTMRSAQSLAPSIRDLLDPLGIATGEIACLAVTSGPGSFTGLRVGVTTAKTLAYATGAKLIAVNTLAALAEPHANKSDVPVWTAIDAQRGEVFSSCVTDPLAEIIEVERHTREEFVSALPEKALLISPLAEPLQTLADKAGKQINSVIAEPSAEGVARIAAAAWTAGGNNDLFAVAPDYYRPSAAEENYRARS